MDHSHPPSRPDDAPPFWRSRHGVGWLVFGVVAVWYLWAEHRAHLAGAWPFLLVLACPLAHVFMHRGHRHHGDGGAAPGPRDDGAAR